MLDLSTIRFAVNTDALDLAVTKVAALGTSVQGLAGTLNGLKQASTESATAQIESAKAAKLQAEANLATAKAGVEAAKSEKLLAEAATERAKANTEASKAALADAKSNTESERSKDRLLKSEEALTKETERSTSVLERQQTILKYSAQGFSSGEAAILATAEAAKIAATDLNTLMDVLQSKRTITGGNPFDKSLSGLRELKNEYKLIQDVQRQYNTENELTRKQMENLYMDKRRLVEAIKIENQNNETNAKTFSDVKAAVRALNAEYLALAGSVNSAESANKSIVDTNNKAASANAYLERELQKVRAATESTNSELNRSTSNSIVRFDNALKASGKTLSEQTVLLNEYRNAQVSLQKTAASRNNDYITRAVAPQITDIVVGLATGQSPLTVMLQQGGQLRDQLALAGVAGKEMESVMTNAMLSMGTSIKNTAAAIGGMFVNAFAKAGSAVVEFIGNTTGLSAAYDASVKGLYSLARGTEALTEAQVALMAFGPVKAELTSFVGAVSLLEFAMGKLRIASIALMGTGVFAAIGVLVALAVSFKQVSQENDELARTLQLSGGMLALSHSSAIRYVESLTKVGATTGEATQAILSMAKAGNITKDELLMVGASAVEMSKWAGVSIDEVVKKYSDLKKEPVKAILELAQATGMVSPEIIKNIQALTQQGETLKAGELAMKSYSDITNEMLTGMKGNYSSFGKFIIELKDRIAQFFSDVFKLVMLAEDPSKVAEEKLVKLQKRILDMRAKISDNKPDIKIGFTVFDNQLAALEKQEQSLQKVVEGYRQQNAELEKTKEKESKLAIIRTDLEKIRLREQGPQQKASEEKTRLEGMLKIMQASKDFNAQEEAIMNQAIQHQQDIMDRRTKTASASLEMPHSNEVAIFERENSLLTAAKNKALTNDLKNAKASYEAGKTDKYEYLKQEQDILEAAYTDENSFAEEQVAKRAQLYLKEVDNLIRYRDKQKAANVNLKDEGKANAKLENDVSVAIENAARSMGLFNDKLIQRRELALDTIETNEVKALKEITGNIEKARVAMVAYNEATRHRNEMIDEGIKNQDQLRYATPEEAAIIRANAEAVKYYTGEISKLNKEKADAARELAGVSSKFDVDSEQVKAANERVKRNQENLNKVIADQKLGIDKAATDAHATYYKDKFKEVADVISGSITEALFNGGASGTKMLRDYLIKVLKQKITLEIEVSLVKPAMDYAASFLGLPGSGSSTGSGGGLLSGIFGAANTASTGSSLLGGSGVMTGLSNGLTAGSAEGSFSGMMANSELYSTSELVGGGVAAAGPYALAAIAAYSLLKDSPLFGGGGHTTNLGEGSLTGSSSGIGTIDAGNRFGNAPQGTIDLLQGLQSTYVETIKSLGGSIKATNFAYGSNDSNGGQFSISGSVQGSSLYNSGVRGSSPQAIKDAAAQAVFTALQQSDLPKYLSSMFDGLDASAMTEAQINAVLTYAKGIQTLHTTLESMPWIGLHDLSLEASKGLIDLSGGLDKLVANLGTFYQNFYTQGEQTTRTTKLLSESFKALGVEMPTVDANMRLWYRSEVERTMALDQSIPANQQALVSILGLQSAVNTIAPAFDTATISAITLSTADQTASAARTELLAQRKVQAELDAAAMKAQADAHTALVLKVDGLRDSLMKAGDAVGAFNNAMQLVDTSKAMEAATKHGGFNAGAFNAVYAQQQAKVAQDLIQTASANALQIKDVSKYMLGLGSYLNSSELTQPVNQGMIKSIVEASGGIVGDRGEMSNYAVRDAVQGLTQVISKEQIRQQYKVTGAGIVGISGAASDSYTAQSYNGSLYKTGGVEYAQAIEALNWDMKKGIITSDELSGAMTDLTKQFGNLQDYAITQEQYISDQIEIGKQIAHAGIDSINYYFNQISASVDELNKSASAAATPLGQVNDAIGRLKSISDVFGISAQSALGLGATSLTDNAQLVSLAASIASQVITTTDAAAAAQRLVKTTAFADSKNLGEAARLIDGVQANSAKSFEDAFARMNDALNKGSITQDQYVALLQDSLTTMSSANTATSTLTTAFESVRKAASSLADQLLINKGLTSLTAQQTVDEAQRQYQATLALAKGGDVTASGNLSSITQQMLQLAQGQATTAVEYNRLFGTTINDLRSMEALGLVSSTSTSNTTTTSTTGSTSIIDGLFAQLEQLRAKLTPTGSSVPMFADGGSYGGGLAIVGENGAELINFNSPGQVYNNAQTQNLLSNVGGSNVTDNTDLVQELQALRTEVSMLRIEAQATAVNTSKINRNVDRLIVPTTTGDALQVKTTT